MVNLACLPDRQACLFLGPDFSAKEKRAELIKKELFKGKASVFDEEVFWGRELRLHRLSEALKRSAGPSGLRLLIIKEIDKLEPSCQEALLVFLKKPLKAVHLILDSEREELKEGFLVQLSRLCKVMSFKGKAGVDVFGLGRAIAGRMPAMALKLLNQLLLTGEKPPRILGFLLWQWKKLQSGLSEQDFSRGLRLLQEADLNIKRGRLRPDFALELLVTKLALCTAPRNSRRD